LCVFDDGTGPALYVGGAFGAVAGGIWAPKVAKWDGSAWHSAGNGLSLAVRGLTVFDDGSGPALFAVGGINEDDPDHLMFAKRSGVDWTVLTTGGNYHYPARAAIATYYDSSVPSLYVGGPFPGWSFAGNTGSFLAVWGR
jgi:hypothetical protein